MIEFEILKEVTLAINQDREKKKAEKIKEWKARANNVSEYICSLPTVSYTHLRAHETDS